MGRLAPMQITTSLKADLGAWSAGPGTAAAHTGTGASAGVNTGAGRAGTGADAPDPHAAAAAKVDGVELALDITQMGLDIVGIFDPTPISDGASGLISLARGDFLGAGISALSMVPYVGDAAKVGKLGDFAQTLAKAVDAAKSSPEVAKAIAPAMDKLRQAIDALPLDKLPQPLADAIAPLKSQLDAFARVGASQVSAKVGNNSVTWTQNAAGETLSARATLGEVFSGAKRSSAEVTAQSNVAAKGLADDVGGHIIGHRFTTDQGVKNLFPQNAQFNNSAFKKLENEWGDWIRKKGGSVDVSVELIGNPTRPDKVAVRYRLTDANGELYDVRKQEFVNQAGQTFDREYFR